MGWTAPPTSLSPRGPRAISSRCCQSKSNLLREVHECLWATNPGMDQQRSVSNREVYPSQHIEISREFNRGHRRETLVDIPAEFQTENWPDVLDRRLSLQAAPAVYALMLGRRFGRLRGSSDILYIGETGELGGDSQKCRLRIYQYPNGDHALELRRGIAALLASKERVTFRWRYLETKADARAEERRLLQGYREEHLELPPFNSQL